MRRKKREKRKEGDGRDLEQQATTVLLPMFVWSLAPAGNHRVVLKMEGGTSGDYATRQAVVHTVRTAIVNQSSRKDIFFRLRSFIDPRH